jgi:hypothetical protein
VPGVTGDRAKLHQLKPENLCVKKCTTFAKANMARALQSRRLQLGFRKLGEPVCHCGRPRREKLRAKLAAAR